jgi:hypothetical protein
MFRFISHIFDLHYNICESCVVLKQQLEIANNENHRLLETIVDIVKPAVAMPVEHIELQQVSPKFASFSRRRASLEESARIEARAKSSKLAAKPDEVKESIAALERELSLDERNENVG